MKEEKQELERSMSLKQHTCDRLSAELQLVKQEAENWEYQCLYNEQLVSESCKLHKICVQLVLAVECK